MINTLQKKVDTYGDKALLEIEYGYDGDCDVIISYMEEETDKELEKRLALGKKKREANKADKVKQEERERKELAKLLAKYGGDAI